MPDARKQTEARLLDEVRELRERVDKLERSVAEHKQTEEELRKSEEALKLITDTAEDSIFIKDDDLRYTFVNKVMERTLGRPASDLIGKTPSQVFGEEDAAIVASVDKSVLDGEVVDAVRTLKIDGVDRTFHTVQTPVVDSTGKVRAICGIVRDITERQRDEEALLLHSSIAKNMSEAAYLVRASDSKIIYSNLVFEKMFGFDPGEMIGKHVSIVNFPTDKSPEVTAREIMAFIDRHGFWRGEVKNVKKDGTPFWCYATVSTFEHPGHGKVLVSVHRDITERKQAEDALRQAHEQLEKRVLERTKDLLEANAKLQWGIVERGRVEQMLHRQSLAIEQALDGIAITDMDGNTEYTNVAWATMHGYRQEELLGKHLSVFHTEEQMIREVDPFNTLLIERGSNVGRVGHVTRSGNTFQTDMSCSVIKNVEGASIGIIGRARDVSRELELELQLRHAQKMEAVGVLAGGIAHNLRNRLAAILGWIEIAADQLTEDDIARTSLERAANAGRHTTEQIRQLLKFSRKTRTKRKPIRPGPVVNEGLEFLRRLLPTTIELRAKIAENCGCVMADPSEIQQVIVDLATNASHAMKENGVIEVALGEVEITPGEAESQLNLKEGKYVRLSVGDTGHGMSEEIRERIFEPFFTTKEPGEGTGLGLSVVHGIVRDHGGTIEVQSEIGKGTSFFVFLPLCAEGEPTFEKPEAPRAQPSRQESRRVLLVDDDEDFCEMARIGLELLGHTVESHVNAVVAVESFRAAPFEIDVVITDQLMPGITGLELAGRMRRIRSDVAIILLSGHDEMVDDRQAQDVGICERIAKPATLRDLAAAIQRVLDLPRTSQA